MKITNTDKLIAWMTLLSGLSISAVAVWYSVAGLISIFAAAAIPIAIMGVVLEVGKLVATVWLKQNWTIAPKVIRAYLFIAVVILMLITSMGIFGYLSKAHLDQAVPTGDVAAKVAILDEKIKTERDNIEAARTALKQMDAQVDARLGRSDDEKGAERAVQIRRQQQAERGRLQKDIADAQSRIAKLNEERAPVASELRKVEAEVGPIKYIAALLYGDNPDNNLLERAVRWMIILIVVIFDPLAVVLLLASQYSFQHFRRQEEETPKEPDDDPTPPRTDDTPVDRLDDSNVEPTGVDTSTNETKDNESINSYKIPGTIEPNRVAWTMPMPGTLGGAKIVFPEEPAPADTAEPPRSASVSFEEATAGLPEIPQIAEKKKVEIELAPGVEEAIVEKLKQNKKATPQQEFDEKAQQRREEILEIGRRARDHSIAPQGTPSEAWLTPLYDENENTPNDVLDKVYKEVTASEAKRRRTRGWLQSNFPKQDE